jgi:anthranilate phosphoribosyltransferase
MPQLASLTSDLAAGRNLVAAEIEEAVSALASPAEPEANKAAFLLALSRKGETPTEIAAFARAFRKRARNPEVGEWSARAIDVVGTGGDHAGGFNISSLVTLVLATAGVVVMKHGNRGVTSKCGSADLLAELGFDLEAPPEKIRGALRELNYAFFFAPAWHPAFKEIGPTRRSLAAQGHRTIFNILGPLINPGAPARTLLGVATRPLVETMAAALEELGTEAALVVHGQIEADRGIDELTTATVNHVRGTGRVREVSGQWSAAHFDMPMSNFADLRGGDVAANKALTELILDGRGPAGLVDTIVANAAIGLWLSGAATSVREAAPHAREQLLGGAVRQKIADTRAFFRS